MLDCFERSAELSAILLEAVSSIAVRFQEKRKASQELRIDINPKTGEIRASLI